MKQKRCILVIDDKSQSAVTKGFKSKYSKDFDLDFIAIRTGAAELKKDDSEDLDIDKLKTEIESKIKGKHLDIALSDFELECPYFTGLDAVDLVHKIRKNVSFFVYSGNWNEVIKSVVGQEYQKASIEELVGGVNKLLNSQVIDCIDRTDYQDILIDYLNKEKGNSIEYQLATSLRVNGEMKFESCFPKFKGMTFNEIADMIECHSDARSDEWIKAILVQTIAYLVKVNQ